MKNVKASNNRRREAAQTLQDTLASMTAKTPAEATPKKLHRTKRHYVKTMTTVAAAIAATT